MRRAGEVCGIRLPSNLRESDRLPEPLFTPATKAQSGHDINISEKDAAALVGPSVLDTVRDLTLRLYAAGAAHAESCGIIVADTKFEFGTLPGGDIILIDEVLTPDSSRFWPRDGYAPGGAQKSFDKQFVRDYLERIRWNKQPPVPGVAGRCRGKDPREVRRGVPSPHRAGAAVISERLERLVEEMVDKGVQFDDAVHEFEKRFIARVLGQVLGQPHEDRRCAGDAPQYAHPENGRVQDQTKGGLTPQVGPTWPTRPLAVAP
jgi:hypothetical protein